MIKTVSPSPLSGTLHVMPSKSASHRAVMMAALASGETTLSPLQLSRDIEATLACAEALGLSAQAQLLPHALPGLVCARITGGQRTAPGGLRVLDCGESGSTLRFFLPLALDGRGPVRFLGHGRLMQRPLDVYEEMFRPLGVRWERTPESLTVEGRLRSGQYFLRGDVSSQFITGLLLALPQLPGNSVIRITTPLESRAYVALTRRVQALFGVESFFRDDQTLVVPGGQRPVSPGRAHVESDWSHAAFYLTAGCLAGPITLRGLDMHSVQGDRAIVDILRGMGADIDCGEEKTTVRPARLHACDVDAAQIPDLVPILAVAMAAAEGESRITGAARLRIKESDRLDAMCAALAACGADVAQTPDGLIIRGGRPLHGAAIDGCNDHRIVMAMAVASVLADGALAISDAEAVAKSAPAFWEEFEALGGHAQ